MKFEQWLGGVPGQSEFQVRPLLQDPAAVRFLITWSLFESKCFQSFAKCGELDRFSRGIVAESFNPVSIREAVSHFHAGTKIRAFIAI